MSNRGGAISGNAEYDVLKRMILEQTILERLVCKRMFKAVSYKNEAAKHRETAENYMARAMMYKRHEELLEKSEDRRDKHELKTRLCEIQKVEQRARLEAIRAETLSVQAETEVITAHRAYTTLGMLRENFIELSKKMRHDRQLSQTAAPSEPTPTPAPPPVFASPAAIRISTPPQTVRRRTPATVVVRPEGGGAEATPVQRQPWESPYTPTGQRRLLRQRKEEILREEEEWERAQQTPPTPGLKKIIAQRTPPNSGGMAHFIHPTLLPLSERVRQADIDAEEDMPKLQEDMPELQEDIAMTRAIAPMFTPGTPRVEKYTYPLSESPQYATALMTPRLQSAEEGQRCVARVRDGKGDFSPMDWPLPYRLPCRGMPVPKSPPDTFNVM